MTLKFLSYLYQILALSLCRYCLDLRQRDLEKLSVAYDTYHRNHDAYLEFECGDLTSQPDFDDEFVGKSCSAR